MSVCVCVCVPFPEDFPQAIRQAQEATIAAISAGKTLIEVEFPSASLAAVAGDGEGANEMTWSSQHLRQFTRAFQAQATTTRIFFPDKQELAVAQYGKTLDPNAGSWNIDAVWENTKFQLNYLTEPSGLLDIGLDLSKYNPAQKVQDTDTAVIVAYPSFDPREMAAVGRIWKESTCATNTPLIMFNAELDRLRNGYYPALFYPGMAKLSAEFVPLVEAAYYIHNFKGAGAGMLFRCYPGPWQVLVRLQEGSRVVWTSEERPSLRDVALDILPKAVRDIVADAKK